MALSLSVLVRDEETVKSDGFSIAAIPQDMTIVGDGPFYDGSAIGIKVIHSWQSDSGELADLTEIEYDENIQVDPASATGIFGPNPHFEKSPYLPATVIGPGGKVISQAFHDANRIYIDLLRDRGRVKTYQTFKFKDHRTDSLDVPMRNSGYTIDADIYEIGGVWLLTIRKYSSAGTAEGIYSDPGSGGPVGLTLRGDGTIYDGSVPVVPQHTYIEGGRGRQPVADSIVVSFSGPVNLAPGAFELTTKVRRKVRTIGVKAAYAGVNGQTVATLRLTGRRKALADGTYTLTIHSEKTADAFGRPLDGDANGSAGGNHIERIRILRGRRK